MSAFLRRVAAAGLAAALAGAPGHVRADEAQSYANARFGYAIAIPPGFRRAVEADNGDGVTLRASAGDGELRVWGTFGVAASFRETVAEAVAADRSEGWSVSYQRLRSAGASWSGRRGGRILYRRAIPLCDGAVGLVQLDYEASAKRRFDDVVARLVKGFRRLGC